VLNYSCHVRSRPPEGTGRIAQVAVVGLGLALLGLPAAQKPQTPSEPVLPPPLIVLLVVDQMRADYVDRFQDDWTSGLRRLVTEGARFTNAAYPYLTTVTCPGHATIATGTLPYVHGIFQNTWFDRDRNLVIPCTEDSSVKAVSYGPKAGDGASASRLLVPTLADELRQRGGRVVTLSLKARSAIMLAGHGGTAVTWLAESSDQWETSSAFAPAPVPEVQAHLAANPIEADYRRPWTRALPDARYGSADDGPGENPPRGWTRTFPHVLGGSDPDPRQPGKDFYEHWERSPFADAYLGRFAAALVESMRLGQRESTDVLGVGFSSPDLIGHAFGPASHEVQDAYARLDRTIGALLDRLDTLVGPERYVVALSSDHGVAEIPDRGAGPHNGGRISTRAIGELVEERARAVLGEGVYVSRVVTNDIYLRPGVYQRLMKQRGALDAIRRAIARQPGIARVFSADELRNSVSSTDRQRRAAALSYVPGRSGDLITLARPGWITAAAGTTHGSANPDDQRVPLVLFGAGIKGGEYSRSVSPADIAPTLAKLAGIMLPRAQGQPLSDALAMPQPVASGVAQPAAPR
jgi:predicted AlkP superfamily pyrophosphatase or phosphodiesterase